MPTIVILLLDVGFIAAAIELTALVVRVLLFHEANVGFEGVTVAATTGLLAGVTTSYLTGLYQPALLVQRKETGWRSLLVGIATAMGVLIASHFVWYQALGRTTLLLVGASSAAAVMLWRLVYAQVLARSPRNRVLVLGDTPQNRALGQALNQVAHARYQVAGMLGEPCDGPSDADLPCLGAVDEAVAVCQREGINNVIVVGSASPSEAQHRALAQLRVGGIEIRTAEVALMDLQGQVPIDMIDERWLLNLFDQLDQGRDRVKRLLDIGIAVMGLAVLGTLLPLLYVVVRLDSKGPLFYSQDRVGLGNHVFSVLKIRTMSVAPRDATQSWAQVGDKRTTAVGRLLRRTRIDELPQFWNVLRGEMSVVGPRPEQPSITAQLEEEIEFFSYRHLVKPGITGWAQIHAGYAGSVEESRTKLAYDLYYVRHHTLLLDIDIMLRTFFVMVARIGSR